MFEVSIVVGDKFRGRFFDTEEEAYSFYDEAFDLIGFVDGSAKIIVREVATGEIVDWVGVNLDTPE